LSHIILIDNQLLADVFVTCVKSWCNLHQVTL